MVLALFSTATKNIFQEFTQDIIFKQELPEIFDSHRIDDLIELGEMAEGLATLGDQVVGLAAAHLLWKDISPIIAVKEDSIKGTITRAKKDLVRNSTLAVLCEKLGLEESQITVYSPNKNSTKMGTLLEALVWVIYTEYGLQKVIDLLLI